MKISSLFEKNNINNFIFRFRTLFFFNEDNWSHKVHVSWMFTNEQWGSGCVHAYMYLVYWIYLDHICCFLLNSELHSQWSFGSIRGLEGIFYFQHPQWHPSLAIGELLCGSLPFSSWLKVSLVLHHFKRIFLLGSRVIMLCSVLCKCLLSVTGHFSKGLLSPHPAVRGPRMPPSVNQSMPALNNRKIHLTIVKYMLICKYTNSSNFIPCM